MGLGNRAFKQLNRAPKEIIELFRGLPIANIADNMGRISCIDQGIKNYGGKREILGTAVTVKVPAGDNLLFHMALDMIQEGDVLVVDGNGCKERSQCGEIMCTYAYKKGCAGIVLDGVVRDVIGLRKLDMAVYARGVQANGPFKNGPGEINVPVAIGGIVVYPGDIIVADEDGVLAIRPQEARALAKAARAMLEAETKLIQQIKATGKWDRAVFYNALERSGVESIEDFYDSYIGK